MRFKLLNNVLASTIQQLIMIVINLITIKLIISIYGSEINGFYNFLLQIFGYFKLIEGGLTAAAIYSLYRPLADNNFSLISANLKEIQKSFNKIALLFFFLTLILAIYTYNFINITGQSNFELFLIVMFLGLGMIVEFLWVIKERILLTADQKIYIISYINLFYNIFQLILIIVVIEMNWNFYLIWLWNILLIVFKAVIFKIYNQRNYSLDGAVNSLEGKITQKGSAIYNQILGAIQLGSPVILTTLLFQDFTLTSIVSVYILVITGINKILDIFKSGIYPFFGILIAKGETKSVKKYFKSFESIYLMVLFVIVTSTVILINPFVSLYLGEVYTIFLMGILFALDLFFYNVKVPLGTVILASGKFKETRFAVTLQAMIIVVGGVILGKIFGVEGIIVASILANLYRNIDMVIFVEKYIIKGIIKTNIKRVCIGVLLFGGALVVEQLNLFNITNWMQWCFVSILCIVVATTLANFAFLLFDRVEYLNMLKMLKKVILKR